MIQRQYDASKPYRVVRYARMSDLKQNARSPEQQLDTIQQILQRHACPWTTLQIYIDRGIKGRYVARRPEFQRMLREIATGQINPDLIVVDTLERLGRADEIEEIRRKLRVHYGVLVVAADNGFADPTGVVGKAVGMVEQIRSTEDTRIKAHNVIRGKKDTIRRKRFPGGPTPFGYRRRVLVDQSGTDPKPYSVLEPDPDTAWIIRRIFQKACETQWGDTRLARDFNADPAIPEKFKPFYAPTIRFWLDNEVYVGVGKWGEHCTDIIDDVRVIEPNPNPEEIVRVEEYCPPLVSPETFDTIQRVRRERAARSAARRRIDAAPPAAGKLIQPMAGGLSLKYPLSGLVKCGQCGACMIARSSGRKSKAGTSYAYYVCPRSIDGACANGSYVHEGRLWSATVSRLRGRLWPVPQQSPEAIPAWFAPLVGQVAAELNRLRQDRPGRAEDRRQQIETRDRQLAGWRDSLGKPDLDPVLRRDLEASYAQVSQEKAMLAAELAAEEAMGRQLQATLDPHQVLDGLKRLAEVLAADSATLINLELARHIERLECFPDGNVVVSGTFLGLFEGAVELLNGTADAEAVAGPESSNAGLGKVRPRRLARRKVDTLSAAETSGAPAHAPQPLDPHRFADLAGTFIWKEEFFISRAPCWAEAHAGAVAAKRAEAPDDWPQPRLAEHFKVSIPTIRKALRIAAGSAAASTPKDADGKGSVPPQTPPPPPSPAPGETYGDDQAA